MSRLPDHAHRASAGFVSWLTESVPRGRVAAFRTVVYLFVACDPWWFTPWVRTHAAIPGAFYQPLLIGRLLHLPTPTPVLVNTIFWLLIPLALLAATGRAPRLLGWTIFILYFEWMIIAMSYGKVDHDRFSILIALAVLPTAGAARHGDKTPTERGGWALRITQIGVVSTYFFASWAKLRYGGLGWLTSATLERAMIRRGTPLTDLLTSSHWILVVAQFGIVAFELSSPIVFFVGPRLRYAMVAFFYTFHAFTFATITISFMPHLFAMTSFLPLEKIRPIEWTKRLVRRGGVGGGEAAISRERPAEQSPLPSAAPAEPAGESMREFRPEDDADSVQSIGRQAMPGPILDA